MGARADGDNRVGKLRCEEWDMPLVMLARLVKGDRNYHIVTHGLEVDGPKILSIKRGLYMTIGFDDAWSSQVIHG